MVSEPNLFPVALTIAGFDPSGGAGVLADMRTFAAFELQTSAAITSITFQNSTSVFGAIHQSGEAVRAQVMPLLADGRIVCSKTGMLPTREVVLEVARLFRETDLPRPVVDPVIFSSSGQRLMEESALAAVIDALLPLARLMTPNIPEAETLTGITITSEADMREAAALICAMGAKAVLVKGGHLSGDAIDLLDNEGKVTVFRERRASGSELHGSGCILSAAIAAGLGKGMTLEDSVGAAKNFVLEAIKKAGAGS
ncbi:MAG TPA: bifunctional hydroxymethylpyrimidine kinase/phosphomethylpyrimidine kinase [Pyrinomonadaceae bacterium]|jgi:hydroxymethylpyrimidine kinase/phosphomethylpyrimidine kinase|nr:bifunctional hydroxymethylpyrimidine kinase/phosphomethylpyrimidine kinase [Pyrinomonadaceae bacterium]